MHKASHLSKYFSTRCFHLGYLHARFELMAEWNASTAPSFDVAIIIRLNSSIRNGLSSFATVFFESQSHLQLACGTWKRQSLSRLSGQVSAKAFRSASLSSVMKTSAWLAPPNMSLHDSFNSMNAAV